MSWVQIYLWFNGLVFVGYGLACLWMPALPAGYAGLGLEGQSGTVEVVAMYGGLQTGFGLLLILGARDASRREVVLLAAACVVGGLAMARLFGMTVHGPSAYNLGAAAYEVTTALLALLAMRSQPRSREATT